MKALLILVLILISNPSWAARVCYEDPATALYYVEWQEARSACSAAAGITCDADTNITAPNGLTGCYRYMWNENVERALDSGDPNPCSGYETTGSGYPITRYHKWRWYRCPGTCPDGTTHNPITATCDDDQCHPPGEPPHVDMVWSYEKCQWEFNGCTSERSGIGYGLSNTPGASVGDTACVSGCQYVMTGTSGDQGWWAATDSQCTGGETTSHNGDGAGGTAEGGGDGGAPDPNGGDGQDFENYDQHGCAWNAAGDIYCMAQDDEGAPTNCGYFNGELVCVDSIPDNECRSTAAGAIMCVGGPPVPPNTQPIDPPQPPTLNPIPPDIGGITGTPDTGLNPGVSDPRPWHGYTPGTVEGPGGGFTPPGTAPGVDQPISTQPPRIDNTKSPSLGPGTHVAATPGGDETVKDDEGEEPIVAPGPIQGPDVGEFDDEARADEFMSELLQTPIGQAFDGLTFSDASGSCPAFSEDAGIFGTFSLSQLCPLYDEVAPYIEIGALLMWAIIAVRLFLEG